MKLIIFGATGGTGMQLVSQALAKGYEVTAFCRDSEKMIQDNSMLNTIQGDVLCYESVERAIEGHDAVFCALGMTNIMDKSKLRAKGTENIIRAMQQVGVKRFICLSAFGAGDSLNQLPFYYKYLLLPLIMRHLYLDHNLQEDFIRQSDLDWTVVRPVNLTAGNRVGAYKQGENLCKKTLQFKISRADTAEFMLKQLLDDLYLRAFPGISY